MSTAFEMLGGEPFHFEDGRFNLQIRHSEKAGACIMRNGLSAWFFDDIDCGSTEKAFETLSDIFAQENIKSLPISMPSFIAWHRGDLYAYNSLPGTIPFYILDGSDGTWLTTQAKAFRRHANFRLKLVGFDQLKDMDYGRQVPAWSVFSDIGRLRPGELILITETKSVRVFPEVTGPGNAPAPQDEDAWAESLYTILSRQTNLAGLHGKTVAIALSGGYDSGSVAGLLGRQGLDIHAVTTGSAQVNEFNEAALVCDMYGFEHHCITVNEEEYLANYVECLYLNEINHPIIADAFGGLFLTYREAARHSKVLYTGYGADILLGNLMNSELENINHMATLILQRSAVSGELSTAIADSQGIEVRNVYLSRDMIYHCLSMPAKLKFKHSINKFVQRKMIEKHSLIPEELLEIKKKGLDAGAGLPAVMNRVLRITDENADVQKAIRARFLYECLRELFEIGTAPGDCDIPKMIHSAIKNS